MAFTVTSNSFKDGDYLPKEFILSADFGFGCAGGNKSPHLKWSGAPAGTKSFAVTCLRPRRADRLGLLALAGGEHPGQRDGTGARRRQRGRQAAGGRLQTRTDFGAPGYGGPCPPEGDHPHRYLFTVFAVCADKLRREGRHVGGGGRLQLAFQHAGQGGDHGAVQEVSGRMELRRLWRIVTLRKTDSGNCLKI